MSLIEIILCQLNAWTVSLLPLPAFAFILNSSQPLGLNNFTIIKKIKYLYLEGQPSLVFTPVETLGVLGPLSLIFLKELGHRVSVTTGDTKTQKDIHTCSSTFQWLYKGEMLPPSEELHSFADLYSV